jgi:hypothetical protein|tara:strand:- start:2299 stop:2970 length:672 start_codon:yes stop_codon:yes gene_type:complete
MAQKYKLKEADQEVGDVRISNGVKTKVTDIDDNTGAISWSVEYIPNFEQMYELSTDLVDISKSVYTKTKDDKVLRDIYEESRKLRNRIRTHIRSEYPDQYKTFGPGSMKEDEVEETSMSGAAGAYNTPYAFVRKPLKPKGSKKKKKSKYKMSKPSGLVNYMDYAVSEGNDPGASLGPGPKASEDGVNDNAYVKQFKYQLVKKNKDGTYVQPGSTLPVRKLWGE